MLLTLSELQVVGNLLDAPGEKHKAKAFLGSMAFDELTLSFIRRYSSVQLDSIYHAPPASVNRVHLTSAVLRVSAGLAVGEIKALAKSNFSLVEVKVQQLLTCSWTPTSLSMSRSSIALLP